MTRQTLVPLLALALAACAGSTPEPEPAPAPTVNAPVTDGCAAIVRLFLALPETTSVTKVAVPIKMDPPPLKRPYPRGVLGRDGEASVSVTVFVDTLGKPDMSTFKVVQATHPWLGTSLKKAITKWKFTPAEKDGCKVPRTYQLGAAIGQ